MRWSKRRSCNSRCAPTIDINENIHLGLQGKWVDERFSTDLNDETTPAYTVVDFDASWAFPLAGDQELEFQFNVTNVLDEEYYGTISSGIGGPAPRRCPASARARPPS